MHGMEQTENNSLLARSLRAGKRTYFFDVKETKRGDKYLTVTESKRKYNTDGTFYYEKHKLFLYNEDFDKFSNALESVLEFIKTGVLPDDMLFENEQRYQENTEDTGIQFEDLEA